MVPKGDSCKNVQQLFDTSVFILHQRRLLMQMLHQVSTQNAAPQHPPQLVMAYGVSFLALAVLQFPKEVRAYVLEGYRELAHIVQSGEEKQNASQDVMR